MVCLSTLRMLSNTKSNAVDGVVKWTPIRSLWTFTMSIIGVSGAYLTFSLDAMVLFLITTAITICAGHSVGMHRLLIHRSFECPKWLEYFLVYLGTLVGMAGPFGMIYAHDIRDWAQRQKYCHDLHAHRQSFLTDAFWQMHCKLELQHPPVFKIEKHIQKDSFYMFLERTWMLQQLPWAFLFWVIGGWSWVIWGVALRIAVSLTGHWVVGHFSHKTGHQGWRVNDVAVQGYNIPYLGLITFGECWHGNHHAFPESARLGVERGQSDPGWWLLQILQKAGIVWNIKIPEELEPREGLERVDIVKSYEKTKPHPHTLKQGSAKH